MNGLTGFHKNIKLFTQLFIYFTFIFGKINFAITGIN